MKKTSTASSSEFVLFVCLFVPLSCCIVSISIRTTLLNENLNAENNGFPSSLHSWRFLLERGRVSEANSISPLVRTRFRSFAADFGSRQTKSPATPASFWVSLSLSYGSLPPGGMNKQHWHLSLGTRLFREHKIWSGKKVHIIFVFVTSIEGTPLFRGKGQFFRVLKPIQETP